MLNKTQKLFYMFILLISSLLKQFYALDYCCCLFHKDPFRGLVNHENKIMSFDHSYFDKEGMGYKMINQCYKQNNGFPSFENIDSIKKENYTRDISDCNRECTLLTRDLNEKFDILQEENRTKEANRLNKFKKKLEINQKKKMKHNTENLYKGKPCKSQRLSPQSKKDKFEKSSSRNFQFINKDKSIDNRSSDSDIYDLSSDSDNLNGLAYLELNNPKFNIQLRIDQEEMQKNFGSEEEFILDEKSLSESSRQNTKENETNKKTILSHLEFEQQLEKIKENSDGRLSEKIKNNPNYLLVKSTNFKEDEETNVDSLTDEEIKAHIERIDEELIYLNKKNKRPIDFILDRFKINDKILLKIIRIFESSLDEVINNVKTYYEDTLYFQFKVACKRI